MALTQNLKILALLDMRHAASREMVTGILRFAAAHHDLEVQFSNGHSSVAPLDYYKAWKPDALIADVGCAQLSKADFSALAGKAVVYVNAHPRKDFRKPHAVITTDERQLAVAATNLLIGKKLENFAFVGAHGTERWSVARGRLFGAALKDRGHKVIVFSGTGASDWRSQEMALSVWLKHLPKPCGIWVACDDRAKQVLDACRIAEVSVPEQVQVLGVDDEGYICEQTIPSLSSLAPDFESGGFDSAMYLYELLKGKQDSKKQILKFGLKGAVERLSTSDVNGTARRVSIAREFIRKNAAAGISVPDVAASLRVSTRLLEKDYKSVTGHTVLEDLIDLRIAKVKEMLRKTSTPIDNIGPFCGFKSPAHLKTLFKRTVGMTMSAYRKQGRG